MLVLACLHVTLNNPSITISLLSSLVPKEIVAYQFAFDLVEGRARDFFEGVWEDLPQGKDDTKEIFENLHNILGGEETVRLYLEFLKWSNQVDMLILKHSKDALEPRSSIYHSALMLQNAFMHAGTTSDIFLRDNQEWLAMATNWAKFSTTAVLGVIHKGYFQQGMNILSPYLPQPGTKSQIQGAVYSEGGALYALGMINAYGGGQTMDYLRETLRNSQNEVVQHSAALGLSIAGMGSQNNDVYDDLEETLFSDSVVAGEAAHWLCHGLDYARFCQPGYEKIIWGVAMGLSFVFYRQQEEAEDTIWLLLADKDPIMHYRGVYTLALAYVGTSNNDALHYASVFSKNDMLGVPHLKEIINVATNIKTPSSTVYLESDIGFKIWYNPDPTPTIIDNDSAFIESFAILDAEIESKLHLQSPWLLWLSFKTDLFIIWSEDNPEKFVTCCHGIEYHILN
ncbi:hypothetical protein EDC04DRAFT_3002415 [Pisolithus marmoratus]|nr:hypothetical protein EDC04DRAFT_3002415 [Pisolithus marmoratus]